jgi:nitrate reductase gamma subunit
MASSWYHHGIIMALLWHDHGIIMASSWHHDGTIITPHHSTTPPASPDGVAALDALVAGLGFGRIVGSETEAPIMLANLV